MNILIVFGVILLILAYVLENVRASFYEVIVEIHEDYINELEKIIQGL
jgi:hypothetical protein